MRRQIAVARDRCAAVLRLALAGVFPGAGGATAEEVYAVFDASATLRGTVIHETEVDAVAVWVAADGSTRFYIDGLGAERAGEGTFRGFYVFYGAAEGGVCRTTAKDHLGAEFDAWGRLELDWEGGDIWTMRLGRCDGPFVATWTGRRT